MKHIKIECLTTFVFRFMCGLTGIFHLNGTPIETPTLLRMNRLIRHRGPDDEGFLLVNTISGSLEHFIHDDSLEELKSKINFLPGQTSANLGIGYRRLSILDVSAAGHQPMSDPDKNVWITFNGEIFNYLEIRQELISLSHQFISESDTEVLLHAYLQWGTACLQKFIGMFSFVIYDNIEQKLFIARDRIGIKPLNYYFDGNTFIWSSEEKQIVRSGLIPVQPNETKILEFLSSNKYFEDNESFFKEIQQLPAAHFALVDQNGMTIHKYWNIQIPNPDEMFDESQSVSCIQNLLNDSIRLRLRSDVPLGIALSGGIDSSTICCLARRLTDTTIQTFSVYYEGKQYDERKYIEEVLKSGSFKSTFYTANDNIQWEAISDWIYHMDAPTTGASPFSAYQNYKNVRKAGIVVLLNGQGGDELFAGYPYFIKYHLADLLKNKQWDSCLRFLMKYNKIQGIKSSASHIFLALKALQLNQAALRTLEHKKYSTPKLYPDIVQTSIAKQTDSLFTQALYDSIKTTHLPHMLRWEDRNSMANSIESRVPFLDHRLVEKSFYIPAHLKLKDGKTKHILRQSMNNIVPDLILNRTDKIGFGTPTDKWTQYFLSDNIKDLIHSNEFTQRNWWHGKKIRDRFNNDITPFGTNELWRIMNCELWYKSFFN